MNGTVHPAAAPTGVRTAPRLGGFNRTLLGLELRRTLRNRRTVVFTLLLPTGLFLAFSGSSSGGDQTVGAGNVAAYVMVSMALYGAALTTASAGSSVALERSLGWSRQLRLTPLSPVAYVAVKATCALALGAVAVTAVNQSAGATSAVWHRRSAFGQARSRLTALITALSEALLIDSSMPTPHVMPSSPRAST